MAALAPRLAELGHPAEALEAARAIEPEYGRSAALVALAPRLAPTERDQALREALEAARAIGDEGARSWALAALAPRLAELGHPAEAVETARAIGDERARSRRLAALAPPRGGARPPGRGAGGGASHRELGGPVRGVAALAPHLGPTERDRALREALEAARAIGKRRSRSEALAALAPRLAELGHPAEALEAARAIGDERSRWRWPRWPRAWRS